MICFNWINANGPGIQAIATALLVCITVFYARRTSQMAKAMKKANEDQMRQLKIKAGIFTALFQRPDEKNLEVIARETGHTEDEIKSVLPDWLGPKGPIRCTGSHERGGPLYFRVSAEWDMLGPAQRQKVKSDFVSALLDGVSKTLEEIKEKKGHSIETLINFLPELLDPCGPVICTMKDGVAQFRLKTAGYPPFEERN